MLALSFRPIINFEGCASGDYNPEMFGVVEPLMSRNIWENFSLQPAFEALSSLGVRRLREMTWMTLLLVNQTTVNLTNAEILNFVISNMTSINITIMGFAQDFPNWMTGIFEGDSQTVPYRNITVGSDYMSFLERYKESWETIARAFPNITMWEIGNEFNADPFLHPQGYNRTTGYPNFTETEKAEITTDLLYYGSLGIHLGNPNAKTVLGGLAPGSNLSEIADFLEKIYDNIESGKWPSTNTDDYFQIASWHPYLWTGQPNMTNWVDPNNAIRNVMVRHGDENKKVVFSEFGYNDHNNSREDIAGYLLDAFQLARDNFPWLETIYWFRLVEPDQETVSQENPEGFGLIDSNWTWKPVAYAYQWLIRTCAVKEFNESKALDFLLSLLTNYNDDKWLCREDNKSTTYWIYNDNALAFQILSNIGNRTQNSTLIDAAEKIRKTIENQDKYNFSIMEGNDRIEVMFKNQTISFPPYSGTGYHHSPIINSDMQLGPNLVMNPSVEMGSLYPDDWNHSDPNLVKTPWSTRYNYDGNKSIGLNITTEDADWRCKTFAVEPLKHYMITCYVHGYVKRGDWFIKIRWFNSSDPDPSKYGVGENFTQISPGNYTEWAQETLFDFTCPSGASYADVQFMAKNGTGELYADYFAVKEIMDFGTFIVRHDGAYMQIQDWQDYADLLLFGVLDRYWRNNASYMDYWNKATKMFNGTGFIDKAFNNTGKFETYKLALFIITANIINQTQSIPQNYTQIFGNLQSPNGGVVTHYLEDFAPDPDATENVETTCLVIYTCLSPEEIPKTWIPEFPSALAILLMLLTLTSIATMIKWKKGLR
jgi:hypothetical protein